MTQNILSHIPVVVSVMQIVLVLFGQVFHISASTQYNGGEWSFVFGAHTIENTKILSLGLLSTRKLSL